MVANWTHHDWDGGTEIGETVAASAVADAAALGDRRPLAQTSEVNCASQSVSLSHDDCMMILGRICFLRV